MKIVTILLCIVTILSFVLGTLCYLNNVGECRVDVYESFGETKVQHWSVFDNMYDPFSFEAGLFWDLGLILLVVSSIFIYICVKKRSSATKKKISLNGRIVISSIIMLVSVMLVIFSLANDAMWLGVIALFGFCIAFIFMQRAWRTKSYQKMSDDELIRLYQECAINIQKSLIYGSGGKLKGVTGNIRAEKENNEIAKWREKGELIGTVLEKRGYTVNYSLLRGEVSAAKSNSDLSNIIKSAVVGGIIAGDVGAVIGAAHAMNKNNKK